MLPARRRPGVDPPRSGWSPSPGIAQRSRLGPADAALVRRRRIGLQLVIIASAPLIGGHYSDDVLAGLAVAGLAVAAAEGSAGCSANAEQLVVTV